MNVAVPASSESDPFAALARFYDLDLEGYVDDLHLYRHLAAEVGGAVLELGCGTGRVTAALVDENLTVVGIDLSPNLLAIARERLAGSGVTLHLADFRTVSLEERFGLVLIPLGGLQHMSTTSDLVAALATAAHHLAPGGLVVVDVEAPTEDDFTPIPQPLVEHWTKQRRLPDGQWEQVTKLVSVVAHPVDGSRDVTWHFDVQRESGSLRRTTAQFPLRTITLGELELAGRLAGLDVNVAWGDYDFSPVDDGADPPGGCIRCG